MQLTTDAHRPYLEAVETAFGADIDYAVLQKIYGSEGEERRYSPARCLGVTSQIVTGNSDGRHISMSYVERQNLTSANAHASVHASDECIQQES